MGVDGTRRNRYNLFHVETYRRGHNGADSKSVCLSGHAGSNPAVSVSELPVSRELFCFMQYFKMQWRKEKGGLLK